MTCSGFQCFTHVEPSLNRFAIDGGDKRAGEGFVCHVGGWALVDDGGDDGGLIFNTGEDAYAFAIVVIAVFKPTLIEALIPSTRTGLPSRRTTKSSV